jgi:hypothetical protein
VWVHLANEATFSNLSSGVYTYEVRTEDGCIETGSIDIIDPPALTATSALTKPLTCADGEITVYPVGGTPPYTYFVNSTTVSQTVPQIVVSKPLPAGGVFNITGTFKQPNNNFYYCSRGSKTSIYRN